MENKFTHTCEVCDLVFTTSDFGGVCPLCEAEAAYSSAQLRFSKAEADLNAAAAKHRAVVAAIKSGKAQFKHEYDYTRRHSCLDD